MSCRLSLVVSFFEHPNSVALAILEQLIDPVNVLAWRNINGDEAMIGIFERCP